MVKTYRDVAIEQMIATVKESIEQFRTQLGAAIDSVEFVKRALDRQVHDTDHGKGPA